MVAAFRTAVTCGLTSSVMGRLDEIDLTLRLDREEYEERLNAAQEQFLKLRLDLGGETNGGNIGPGLLIVVEGVDAGG